MSSPIFDSTFGTGRFKSEEPMTTDQSQSDAGPKGIDLDDVDRAYDKWAEHRNSQSRLDAFRAGVEFGLRHTAPPRPDVWPFGYQDTFNLISDAIGGHIGISVSKFEKAYNKLRARADRSGPRPHASAGLIEAAEIADARAVMMLAGSRGGLGSMFADQSATDLKELAKFLRYRAADRSGK